MLVLRAARAPAATLGRAHRASVCSFTAALFGLSRRHSHQCSGCRRWSGLLLLLHQALLGE
jgi:hypothetical protein